MESEKLKQLLNIYIINPEIYHTWASTKLAMISILLGADQNGSEFFIDRIMSAIEDPIT